MIYIYIYITIFNGTTRYFDWAIENDSYLT